MWEELRKFFDMIFTNRRCQGEKSESYILTSAFSNWA